MLGHSKTYKALTSQQPICFSFSQKVSIGTLCPNTSLLHKWLRSVWNDFGGCEETGCVRRDPCCWDYILILIESYENMKSPSLFSIRNTQTPTELEQADFHFQPSETHWAVPRPHEEVLALANHIQIVASKFACLPANVGLISTLSC